MRLSLTSPTVLSGQTAHQPQGALPPPAQAAFSRAQTLAQWTHTGSERLALPPYEPPAAQTAGLPPAAHQPGAVPPAAQQALPAALPPPAQEPGAAGILPPAAGTALPPQLGTAGILPPAAGIALPPQLGAAGILPPTNGTALPSPSTAPAPAGTARLTQRVLDRIKNRGGVKPADAVSASPKGPTTPKPMKAMKAATAKKAMKAMKAAKPERVVWQKKPPMPTRMDEPIFYKKGVIYCSIPKQKFRIIRALPDYATETSVRWPKGKITAASWAEALSKIDNFKK